MDLIYSFIEGPVLPATCLLAIMIGWSLLAMLGTVDLELPGGDMDLDVDLDMDGSHGIHAADGLGVLALKWLNLRDVPLVLWMAVLAVVWWVVSASTWILMDSKFFASPGWLWSTLLVAKNLALAIPLTKLVTSPMKNWFVTEQLNAHSLVGQECEISSLEASPTFGQVKYRTEGAPLLLNVRTDGAHLAKGTKVWITHYDAARRQYIVSPTGVENIAVDSASKEQE